MDALVSVGLLCILTAGGIWAVSIARRMIDDSPDPSLADLSTFQHLADSGQMSKEELKRVRSVLEPMITRR